MFGIQEQEVRRSTGMTGTAPQCFEISKVAQTRAGESMVKRVAGPSSAPVISSRVLKSNQAKWDGGTWDIGLWEVV